MHSQLSIRSIHFLLAFNATLTTSLAVAASNFPVGDYAAGEIVMHFDASGHVRLTQGKQVLVDGDFTVDGNNIRLTDKSGPMACAKGEETGVYRWTLDHDALTLAKIDDKCEGRSGDIVAQPWKRRL